MKRFLICALAAVGMVACVSEDVVQLPKSEAISFADAFIGNSTRAEVAADPSTTKANLEAFDVWAYMTSTDGIVLEDENLTLTEKGNWYYSNTQYWTPKRNYFFAALAPMDSANWNLKTNYAVFPDPDNNVSGGAGLVTFENINGSEDLIYATASATTPDRQTLVDEGMPAVKFQFEHLLSKVKFTFHNGFKTDNARLVIENVKMTAPKKGEINLSDVDYKWTLDNEEFTLDFGNVGTLSTKDNVAKLECDYERLTIPADETYTYNIQFDVTLYYGKEIAYQVTKNSAVAGVALEKGHAYNFFTEINPQNLELPAIVFEVEGVDKWIPEDGEDVEHPVVATINNVPYTSLQAAVDAATTNGGNSTIEVVSPVNELVTVTQTTGVNLVINGNNNDYNGTIRVSGCSRDTGAETLVINGFNFKATTGEACVDMNWGTSNQTRYAHNVTISNCTFTMVGAAVHTSPAIDCYQPYNITVKGCEAYNAHSLLQVKGGHNGVAVEDVKVVDCKNGIAFGTHDGPVSVKNAEIKALGYGVRADGSVAATLTVEGVTIEALRPIIVRKATGSYNVVLAGTNTLTAGDYYHVIFTNGDDEAAYVAPTGAFTLTGADDFNVFPHIKTTVDDIDDLNNAIDKEYATINVVDDLDTTTTSAPYVELVDVQDVTLNFNGNTLKSGSTGDYAFMAKSNTVVTVNNVDLDSMGGGVAAVSGAKVIFNGESVYVDSASTSARYVFYAASAGEIEINAGTFSWDPNDNNKRAYVYADAGTKVTINGGTFGKASTRSGYAGIMGTGEVIINGGTFGFDPTAWVASGRTVTKSGSTWTVQ